MRKFKTTMLLSILILISIFYAPLKVNALLDLPTGLRMNIESAIVLKVGSPYAIVNAEDKIMDPTNENVKTILKDSRALVPVRFIAESLGAKVEWDQSLKLITITRGEDVIRLAVGEKIMKVNGITFHLDVKSEIHNSRTYVPVRAISEAFKKKILYKDKVIIITDNFYTHNFTYRYSGDYDNDIENIDLYLRFFKTRQISKESIVLKLDTPYAVVNSSDMLIDKENPSILPYLKNSRTLVPLRFISESLGAKVIWDHENSTAIITLGDKIIKVSIGNKNMILNDKGISLDVAPEIKNQRTFVPLRAISEAFGKKVVYDKKIIIISDMYTKDYITSNPNITENIIDYFHSLGIRYADIINGASINNPVNKNLAVKRGEWIYYTGFAYNGLWKMKEDGTKKTKLASGRIKHLNIIDDWIYYFKNDTIIMKIKTDGSGEEVVYDNSWLHNRIFKDLQYIDGKLYYSTDSTFLLMIDPDSSNIHYKLRHDLNSSFSKAIFYDDKIIFRVNNPNYELDEGIYMKSLDTFDVLKIASGRRVYYYSVDGDYLYYSNGHSIYRKKLTGEKVYGTNSASRYHLSGESELIVEANARFINFHDGWIYFADHWDNYSLYKVRADGSELTKLNDEYTATINIIGDWIYYGSINKTVRIRKDGTQREVLSQ